MNRCRLFHAITYINNIIKSILYRAQLSYVILSMKSFSKMFINFLLNSFSVLLNLSKGSSAFQIFTVL